MNFPKRKNWRNNIELTYDIELASNSKKTLKQAADDMITGVTIGTAQTSEGNYTPKLHCLFGPNPGRYKGEVVTVKQLTAKSGVVKVSFCPEICQAREMGFAGFLSVAAGDGLGTAYEMSKVRLIDINLPKQVVSNFPGPKFGSKGIRRLLENKRPAKPLVALLLKPNTGQPTKHYAKFAKEAALAGVDYIKEDEMQFNLFTCPLIERVRKIVDCLKEAEKITHKKVMYAPNITSGSQKQMLKNAKKVVKLGATAVMINVMQMGLDSLRVLREADIGVPIHIHRSGHDNYTRGNIGISLKVLTKLFRLGGADLIHTGPVFGNLYDPDIILENVECLISNKFKLKKPLPILSRSAKGIVQDSIDYLSTDRLIKDPSNVMFLVDKDVYQDADPRTGSIIKPLKKFVSIVKNVKPGKNINKKNILKKQGLI